MAKGNDGNYLQHCVEVEAAVRLMQACPDGRLHVALTHGMAPFEELEEPKNCVQNWLLYGALHEAAGEPQRNEREIVKAYRNLGASRNCYPNSAELLRAVIGTNQLSGGISELDKSKCEELKAAWTGSKVKVAHSSWRKQLDADGVLHCPDDLDAPWLLSMDPMTYSETGSKRKNLNRSDLEPLAPALEKYFHSGQPGIACFFVYGMKGTQDGKKLQCQFWAFIDDLAPRVDTVTGSYWVRHNGGNRNLAGLLFSDQELAWGFAPPRIGPGRGCKRPGSRMQVGPARQGSQASGESLGGNVCPGRDCGYEFQGNGWDGIAAHWRSKHKDELPYEEAWPLIRSGSYGKSVPS